MKTIGIIAEYNPFHNGHCLQIQEIRRRLPDAAIVAVMSGPFTQRGSAAIVDKWLRAKSAVSHGVSLVMELPAAFSTRSAQFFSGGSVRLLDRLGIVDALAFGSECDDLSRLSQLAKETTDTALSEKMRGGSSYAAALTESASPDALIRQPNVILAVEYLRTLERCSSAMEPMPLPRFAAAHQDLSLPPEDKMPVASASAIRAALTGDQRRDAALRTVPEDMAAALVKGTTDTARLFRPILACLLTKSPNRIAETEGVSEGLEHRLYRAALEARSYEDLIETVRTKRYPRSRIRRILVHLLLELTHDAARRFDEAGPLYARVLAFDDRGRALLRKIEKNGEIPVVTRTAPFLAKAAPGTLLREMLSLDLRATALASLASEPVGAPAANADLTVSPVYLKNKTV